jgi:hypothetical protein
MYKINAHVLMKCNVFLTAARESPAKMSKSGETAQTAPVIPFLNTARPT